MADLRIDGLTGRRVYIAEDRAGRPTDFSSSAAHRPSSRDYAESCPFCAGNEAATPHASATLHADDGTWRVRVVPNKYPAVSLDAPPGPPTPGGGTQSCESACGLHEVVIESPRHAIELTELDGGQLNAVLAMFRDRLRYCATHGELRHATVFKNSGFAAGASLEHLHSQVVALPFVPPAIQMELDLAEAFYAKRGRCAYCLLLDDERRAGERIVLEQSGFAAICAYAGRQPFETWIVPTEHLARFDHLGDEQLAGLAAMIQDVVGRLAHVCRRSGYPLAYNLILHTAPFDDTHEATYHWHWELIPRTTHLAGLEWGAGVYINPVSPERAAAMLRDARP